MNPSGLRIEEKKSEDRSVLTETRSTTSYKSTHSSRSSVLERAREYNRRIDEQNRHGRAKSLERSGSEASSAVWSQSTAATPRSQSAGRAGASTGGNRVSTRERAMASVRKEGPGSSNSSHKNQARGVSQTTDQTHPLTPASSSHNNTRPLPTTPRSSSQQSQPVVAAGQSQQQQTEASSQVNRRRSNESSKQQVKPSPSRSRNSKNGGGADGEAPPDAVVTPELLVDALSGHEDGLLAIAEKLMEHYDAGYDVMGEAIIDAFADVQKLFQHVVEAAHMEGAAFEASRRESEMTELRRQAAAGELRAADPVPESSPATPSGPNRHDEFIDQDVKDALTEAIRKGSSLRESNKHMECYVMFEAACQQSSSLLPVDSDHRGRLQLSIARAESMSPDRACAILRYAMDDVLRSGLRAGQPVPLPDPSKRADVVLNRPKGHPSMSGVMGQAGVVQSSDEALASLIEELKEIMGAPVFIDTPLQSVARRFWVALNDTQKSQQKNEERLEQNLGKLKGDYLLARAEWEEQLTQTKEKAELYKEKYEKIKETSKVEDYMDQARSLSYKLADTKSEDQDASYPYGSVKSAPSNRAGSVASLGSGLAMHAKTIVNSMKDFNCNAVNERNGPVVNSELVNERYEGRDRRPRHYQSTNSASKSKSPARTSNRPRSSSRNKSATRSFREYSRSPQRVDV